MPSLSPVVALLLALNLAVELAKLMLPPTALLPFALWPLGGPFLVGFAEGRPIEASFEPWQLLSYGFLHGSLPHLGFNMLGLWMFGTALERTLGSGPFLRYFIGCVLGAGVLQLFVASQAADPYPTVGASGGLYGLLLAYGLLFPRHRILLLFPPIPLPARAAVLVFALIELVLGVSGTASGIAHFAHLGGLITGFLILQYWRGRLPIKPRRLLLR
ncbi:MAG: rhomboid family intramembrane serine protease [Lysobacterales bacterium]|jgi:membrane associated rhomboid family serine protease|nr:MAG: rhomboid family intramembrane serine protease [Xanthomonadales bacterium]